VDIEKVEQHIGKLVRIILNNNYNYTGVIPSKKTWKGTTFDFTDKFEKVITMDCGMIGMIEVIDDGGGR